MSTSDTNAHEPPERFTAEWLLWAYARVRETSPCPLCRAGAGTPLPDGPEVGRHPPRQVHALGGTVRRGGDGVSEPDWDWTPPIDLAQVDAYLRSRPSPPKVKVNGFKELWLLAVKVSRGEATTNDLRARAGELFPRPSSADRRRLEELERQSYTLFKQTGVLA